MTTTVVNIRDTKDYDVYVGRRVKTDDYNLERYDYANPFKLVSEKDRDIVYNNYERWLKQQHRWQDQLNMDWDLDKLKGKRLACWCAPKKCHADLLAKLADMTYEERWEWANE